MGCPHPDILLKQLTARQLYDWEEYERIEPFGFPAEDARMGIQAAATFWAQGAKDVRPEDFSMSGLEPQESSPDLFAEKLKAALGAVEVPGDAHG